MPARKVKTPVTVTRPARVWPERNDADPEDVMCVLMQTPRTEIREEPAEYRAEKPEESE